VILLICPVSVLDAVCILITQVKLGYTLLAVFYWQKPVASGSLIISVLILLYICLEKSYLQKSSRNQARIPGDLI